MRASDVRDRLQAMGVRASRRLGQHFLLDERIAERHVGYAELSRSETVLEIGPGLGVLTGRLATLAAKVVAVERDRRLASGLRTLGDRVEVLVGDAVRVDLPPFDKVVSNLPYQISSPITFRLLDLPFDRGVLMYQKEFADRLVARAGGRAYSRLSVKAFARAEIDLRDRVPKSAFWPEPGVDSAIVVLRPRPSPFPIHDGRAFNAVVDAAFAHRRKRLENALRLAWGRERGGDAPPEARLRGVPYADRRAGELTPEQFAEVAEALFPEGLTRVRLHGRYRGPTARRPP